MARKEGPAMTIKVTGEDVARMLTDAWNSHDAARLAAVYTLDATVLDPFYIEPLEGRDAIAQDAADLFTAIPDITFRPTKVIMEGESVGLEVMVSGTHTGPLQLPTGLISPTGRRLEFSASGFSDLDAMGKIREERRYFDVAGLLSQLGLLQ
jgi:steroid delta-isomerase-like uncharacterized protein